MTRPLSLLLIATVAFALGSGYGSASPETQVKKLVVRENTILELRAQVKKLVKERDRARKRVRRQFLLIDKLRKEHRRAIRHYPSIPHLIEVAATAYGQSAEVLKRKAYCESKFWPFARNNSSKDSPMGLLQFRPSTWRQTPFARYSIWDPFAQSLAGAWMHDVGRGNEWACR